MKSCQTVLSAPLLCCGVAAAQALRGRIGGVVVDGPCLDNRTPERWFITGALAMHAFSVFGSSGRNILDGPELQTINAGLLRDFSLGEATAVPLRGEAFNFLNRGNFSLKLLF